MLIWKEPYDILLNVKRKKLKAYLYFHKKSYNDILESNEWLAMRMEDRNSVKREIRVGGTLFYCMFLYIKKIF